MLRFFLLITLLFGTGELFSQRFLGRFDAVGEIISFNGKALFSADDGVYGAELWLSDGTAAGTVLLKDIQPGQDGSSPAHFTVFNGEVYFTAHTFQYGTELWKTNGTAAGTVLVADIRAGAGNGAAPDDLVVFQDRIFFEASDDGFNTQLFQTDGTGGGTLKVKDLGFGAITQMVVAGPNLYLNFSNSTLWQSDGTGPGTTAQTVDGNPVVGNLTASGNTLYFSTASGAGDLVHLYKKEGTQTPLLLVDFQAPSESRNMITDVTVVGTKIFFNVTNDHASADEQDALWVTDGTPQGTVLVKAFPLLDYTPSNTLGNFFVFDDKLFFRQGDALEKHLWSSDGTNGGTLPVADVNVDFLSSTDNRPAAVDGAFYFSGNGDVWMSDGTTAGTRRVFNINQRTLALPSQLTTVADLIYFSAADEYGGGLWNSAPAPEIEIWDAESGSSVASDFVVDFGNAFTDECTSRSLLIRNVGLKELVFSGGLVTGKDFWIKGELPGSLMPGEELAIEVYFMPVTTGAASGTLAIGSNDSNEGDYRLDLRGTGEAGEAGGTCGEYFSGELGKTLALAAHSPQITLSSNTITDQSGPGAQVGTLSVPGIGGAFAYTLVNGVGDEDNGRFTISGSNLVTAGSFNYQDQRVFTVRVRATQGGNVREEALTLLVAPPATPPAITDPCLPSIRRLGAGILDVEFNAQGSLFAAGQEGRLMRSTNLGTTWESLNSGVSASLSRLWFFASTGYAVGSGALLKSDDQGSNWFELYTPFQVSPEAVFFLDAQRGFAGGANGTFYRTTDGGRNWTSLGNHFPGAPVALWFWDATTGMACTSFGAVLKTIDGGNSWTAVNVGNLGFGNFFRDIKFTDNSNGFLLSANKLFKSDNGGESWYEITGVTGINLREIRFVNNNTGYIIGGSFGAEVFITTSAGTNWIPVDAQPMSAARGLAVNPAGTTVAISGYHSVDPGFTEPGQLLFTAATGSSTGWQTRNSLRAQQFNAIAFPSVSTGFVFGESSAYKTQDAGASWQPITLPVVATDAAFGDVSTGYIASGHAVYKTSNGGGSWNEVFSVAQNGPAYLSRLTPVSPGVLVAYGSGGVVYRSADAGNTWNEVLNAPLNDLKELTFPTTQTGYGVDLLGKVVKSTDGGALWSVVYTHPANGDFFNTLTFINASTGFLGGKDGLLLKTSNGGLNWTPVFSGITSTITRLVFQNTTVGYAFTEAGAIHRTTDGGASWDFFGSLTFIGISDVARFEENIYFAGAFGNLGKIEAPNGPTQPGYISGDQYVCAGDAVDLRLPPAGAQAVYQWSVPGATFTAENASARVTIGQAGPFTVTVKKVSACGDSPLRTFALTGVTLPPPVIAGPELVAANSDAVYAVSNPAADSRFGWSVDGASVVEPALNQVDVIWGATDGMVQVLETNIITGCRAGSVLAVSVDPSTIVGVDPDADVIAAHIRLYPNPTPDQLHIESSLAEWMTVRIVGVDGRTYQTATLAPAASGVVDLSNLPSGLYLVEISTGNGRLKSVTRIVRQ